MNKINVKINKANFLISLFVFLFFILHFLSFYDSNKSLFVYITFFIIGLISLFALCFIPSFVSHIKVAFSFIFIFFYYAPLEQYTRNVNLWGHMTISDNDYIQVNLIILLSLFFLILSYILFFRKKYVSRIKINSKLCVNNSESIILISISLVCFLYFVLSGEIIGKDNMSGEGIVLSIKKIIRFIPVATLLIFIYNKFINKKKINNLIFTLNSLIVFVLFFPFAGSISRFLLFGTYIIIFSFFIKKLKINSLLPLILIFGFGYIFPAFNFFKNHSIYELELFTIVGDNYSTVDFDAYQMIIEAVKYVESEGILFGKNILTGLLFFVPRSIWPAKQLPSGEIIANFFNAYFTNLSAPYIAEFYLAFGIIGVIIGNIILGMILKKLDQWFFYENLFKLGISSIVFGMLIYLMRGAFLPTFSYTFSLIIAYCIVCIILIFTKKKTWKFIKEVIYGTK